MELRSEYKFQSTFYELSGGFRFQGLSLDWRGEGGRGIWNQFHFIHIYLIITVLSFFQNPLSAQKQRPEKIMRSFLQFAFVNSFAFGFWKNERKIIIISIYLIMTKVFAPFRATILRPVRNNIYLYPTSNLLAAASHRSVICCKCR